MRSLLQLVAPGRCLGCRATGPPPWCPTCRSRADRHRLLAPCGRCGSADVGAAHACWPADAPIGSTTAVYRYRGLIADAVVTAKVRGASSAWRPFGTIIAAAVRRRPPDVHAATFVPTEPTREKGRGFDHARLLAAGVGAALDLPLVAALRAGPGAPDRGARALGARQQLPVGTFRALRDLRGARLLLVDDVLTTGATAGAAAAELVRAGADEVHLAVLARAGGHPLGRPDPAPPGPPGARGGW